MPVPVVDDHQLLAVICTPMTETARAEKLGLTRSSYYRQLERLARKGVIRPRGELGPKMRLKSSRTLSRSDLIRPKIVWTDETGKWEIQGQSLDKWDGENTNNTTITSRYHSAVSDLVTFAFEVRPINRWSTESTVTHLPIYLPWNQLHPLALKNLTIAIAYLINAEAVLVS